MASKPMSEWTVDEMTAVYRNDRRSLQVLSPVPLPDGGEHWMLSREFMSWALAHCWEVLYPCPVCRVAAQELRRLWDAVRAEYPDTDTAQQAVEVYKRGGRGAALKHECTHPYAPNPRPIGDVAALEASNAD